MKFPYRQYNIISVCCVALGLYLVSTPVPTGYSQPWIARAVLTSYRFAELLLSTSSSLGLAEHRLLRFLMKIHPIAYGNHTDVHFYDTVMDTVPVRIYLPRAKERSTNGRGVVFFHGGGWSVWNPDIYHDVTLQIAKELQDVVVSVDYRLAPEYPFPFGFEDCVRVTKFFTQHAQDYGVNPNRIVLFGDSAGGNLATAVSLRLRDEEFYPSPKLQILVYPFLQGIDFHTPSLLYNQDGPLLTRRLCLHYMSLYLTGSHKWSAVLESNSHTPKSYRDNAWKHFINYNWLPDDDIKRSFKSKGYGLFNEKFWNEFKDSFSNPYLFPLHAEDLSNLPHTYIHSCQHDPLRDDSFFFAHRLNKSKVKVSHDNLQICFHGWINSISHLDTALHQLQDIVGYIKLHV